MKIELRNVAFAARLSRETNAYDADVWVNGVLLCHVNNAGHGGCDMQQPAKGKTHTDIQQVDKYIGENYPPFDLGQGLGQVPMTLELLCADLLERHLQSKRLKTMLRSKVVLLKDGKCYTVKGTEPRIIETVKIRNPGAVILNELPFEVALEKFTALAA